MEAKKRLHPSMKQYTRQEPQRRGTNVRFAGAQIPVTKDVAKNIIEIKEAIDYAAEVEADYLVTPEGSLSGYYTEFMETQEQYQQLLQAEHEIVSYARSKSIGLCLGTLFMDNEQHGQIKRDQIRFYDKQGNFIDAYNKIQTISNDNVIPGVFGDANLNLTQGHENHWTGHPIIQLKKDSNLTFETSALICNDMYGENAKGESIARRALYQLRSCENPIEFIIHPTFGLRGTEVIEGHQHPKHGGAVYLEEEMTSIRTTMEDWHRTHLEMLSYQMNMSFLVVDTCSDFSGEISKFKTSSPSGVVSKGIWVTKVEPYGKQYFYHDFTVKAKVLTTQMTMQDRLSNITNPPPVEE